MLHGYLSHLATSMGGELLAMPGPKNPYPGKLGVIEEGAYADLLLINGDPLQDIAILTKPGGEPRAATDAGRQSDKTREEPRMSEQPNSKSTIGKWTGIGLALGVALGAAAGNAGLGVAFGVVVGAAIGAAASRRSKNDGSSA